MNHLLPIVSVAVALFAGCHSPKVPLKAETRIPCNVNPDEVFGKHYTASDFLVWKVASRYDEDRMLMDTKLTDTLFFVDDSDFMRMLLIKDVDTASVGAAVRPSCRQRGWYPMWGDSRFAGYQTLYVLIGKPLLDGTAVAKAEACVWDGRNEVIIDLKKEYHADWQCITGENIGYCLAFKLGERVLTTPMVNGEISVGKMSVSGDYTEEMCCALAAILN